MTKLGQDTGRPVWFLLTDRPTDPVRWQRLMDGVRKARAQGAIVTAQVAGRPVGVMLGVDTALNPFSIRPSYQALLKLPAGGAAGAAAGSRRCARRSWPTRRRRSWCSGCRSSASTSPPAGTACSSMGDPPDYEPEASEQHRRDGAALQPHAGRGRLRLPGRRAGQVPVLPDRRLQRGQPRHHPHHADLAARRCSGCRTAARTAPRSSMPVVPSWMLIALGPRSEARARPAAGADRQAADQRDRGLLRFRRSRAAGAGTEGRCQRDRLRAPAAARAGDPLRPARRRAAAGAAGRRLHRHARVRRAGVRARRLHRRDARPAGARGGDPPPGPPRFAEREPVPLSRAAGEGGEGRCPTAPDRSCGTRRRRRRPP